MIAFYLSVEVFCDVITGEFKVDSKAGNGHKGQDGGDGRPGSNAANVSSLSG